MAAPHPKTSDVLAHRVLLVVLLGALVLVLMVFRPLGSSLLLAAVLAAVLWPIQQWLTRRLRGRGTLAAAILLLFVVALLVGPFVWLSAFLVVEVIQAVQFVSETMQSEGAHGLLEKLPWGMSGWVSRTLATLGSSSSEMTAAIQEQITRSGGSAAVMVGTVLVATGMFLFQAVMMLVALFFFLTNKEEVTQWLDEASPLRRGQTRELGRELVKVCKSIIVSIAATALIQSIFALIGYFIARVPHPFFFFLLTFFFAFVPGIGATSVCLLSSGLLLVTGHPWAALFLAIYAIVVVSMIDNVVKPWLMKGNLQMHGVVIFFALFGGLAAFGLIGLLLGPLSVAFFLALLRIYRRDRPQDPPTKQEQNASRFPSIDKITSL